MENKKMAIVLSSVAVVLFLVLAFAFMYEPARNKLMPQQKTVDNTLSAIEKEYGEIQNQFAFDLPCGVTDFESPFTSPVKCDADKMKKGEGIEIDVSGTVTDEDGKAMTKTKIVINGGEPMYTDDLGDFEGEIIVDSVNKKINVVADKFGYSPIRKVLNAEMISENGKKIEIPKEFYLPIEMRQSDVQYATLSGNKDIKIVSEKDPSVSVTIPANGLENSKGEIVTGEIVGEITYLDPNKSEDRKLTPGFDGNAMMMVGVDHDGRQVFIESQGMVFFHFKEAGSNEILQPRKGVTIVVTQPIPDEEYAILTDKKIQEKDKFTDEDIEYFENLGIIEATSDDELYEIALEHDLIVFNYWYFNERTGLWEEWPVKKFEEDIPNKLYRMEVPRFY